MTNEKLNLIIDICSNSTTTKIIVTDEAFSILWSNDDLLAQKIKNNNIRKYIMNEKDFDIMEVQQVLKKELGEFYKDIIELEWDMTVSKFIEWYWDCDNKCFTI